MRCITSSLSISVSVALATSALLSWYFKDPTFACVGAWALKAIESKLCKIPPGDRYPPSDVSSIARSAGRSSSLLAAVGIISVGWLAVQTLA